MNSFINSQFCDVFIVSARKLLLKNSDETKTCAARIFNLSMKTMKSSIKSQSKNEIGKRNQMLNVHQFKAMHEFIK